MLNFLDICIQLRNNLLLFSKREHFIKKSYYTFIREKMLIVNTLSQYISKINKICIIPYILYITNIY